MSAKPAHDSSWLHEPSSSMLNGLLASGLIRKDTMVVKGSGGESNVRPVSQAESKTKGHSRPITAAKQKTQNQPQVMARNVRAMTPCATRKKLSGRTAAVNEVDIFAVPSKKEPVGSGVLGTLPNIHKILSSNRKFSGKKEATELAGEYRAMLEHVYTGTDTSPEACATRAEQALSVTVLVLDKLIIQIRGYSESHAKLLSDIKGFYLNQIAQIPEMNDYYIDLLRREKAIVANLDDKLSNASVEIGSREEMIASIQAELNSSKVQIGEMTRSIEDLNEKNGQLKADVEELKGDIRRETIFRTRAEQERDGTVAELAIMEDQLSDARLQIEERKRVIEQYEREGAGFKAKYMKSELEITSLQKGLKESEKKISQLLEKQPLSVELTFALEEVVTNDGKKGKKKGPKPPRRPEAHHSSRKGNSTGREPAEPRIIGRTIKTSSSDWEQTASARQEMSDVDHDSESILGQGSACGGQGEDEVVESVFETHSVSPHVEVQKEENTTEADLKPEVRRPQVELPDDYTIDNDSFEILPTFAAGIYRLFPLPINASLDGMTTWIKAPTGSEADIPVKSIGWVVHQIIAFFHSLCSVDQMLNTQVGTVELFRTYLKTATKLEALATRVFQYVMHGMMCYRDMSTCLTFFELFVSGEYTTADYRFFNMLFNVAVCYVYPPVVMTIEDDYLTRETPQFLIHVDIVMKFGQLLFPQHVADIRLDLLREKTKVTKHPDLVDFFAFASQMVMIFRKSHMQFHFQIRNLLRMVGWDRDVNVTEGPLRSFLALIDPGSENEFYDKVWNRFKPQMMMQSNEKATTMDQSAFISFCSDFPDIASGILGIPYVDNYSRAFDAMPVPLQTMINFLRQRFTVFMRQVYLRLDPELRSQCQNIVTRARDALLRCDVMTMLRCYRHFMQVVDLRMTERTPYIVMGEDTTPGDVDDLMDQMKSRELLVASWFRAERRVQKALADTTNVDGSIVTEPAEDNKDTV